MLGLPKGEVFLVPWNEHWSQEFLAEKNRIQNSIGELIIAIHHIGSTAVQGLSAKPIIDIAIEMADLGNAHRCIAPLTRLNYVYRGTDILPDRHYFSKGEPRIFQIHLHQTGNLHLMHQLQFRDLLRNNEQVRAEYELLKLQLAHQHQSNKPKYTAGKSDFIRNILNTI